MIDDPMERLIADALDAAGYAYRTDEGGGNPTNLDFALTEYGIEIEVKRFHSPRIAEQMSRAENVIAVQGEDAVKFVADLLRNSPRSPIGRGDGLKIRPVLVRPQPGAPPTEHSTRCPATKTFPADGENVCTLRDGHRVPHRWMNRAVFEEGKRDG